jgi:hypothetical protein
MISEEDYLSYSRAQTIGIIKMNRKRTEVEQKKENLIEEIEALEDQLEEKKGTQRFRATPLGVDRFHRRYWFFPPSPGIFVEQGAWTTQPLPDDMPLVMPPRPNFKSYDIPTDDLLEHLHSLLLGG